MFNSLRMIMSSGSILGYFLQVVPITVIIAIIYSIIRLVWLKKKKAPIFRGKEIVGLIFVCYITGLFNLIVMPANFWLGFMDGIAFGWWEEILPVFTIGEVNLIPSVIRWLQGELSIGSWVRQMLIGNIAMFLPLGLLLPLITDKVKIKNGLVIAAVVPVGLEVLQLVFGRSLDIDDLICNFIGIAAGLIIAVLLKSKRKREN